MGIFPHLQIIIILFMKRMAFSALKDFFFEFAIYFSARWRYNVCVWVCYFGRIAMFLRYNTVYYIISDTFAKQVLREANSYGSFVIRTVNTTDKTLTCSIPCVVALCRHRRFRYVPYGGDFTPQGLYHHRQRHQWIRHARAHSQLRHPGMGHRAENIGDAEVGGRLAQKQDNPMNGGAQRVFDVGRSACQPLT